MSVKPIFEVFFLGGGDQTKESEASFHFDKQKHLGFKSLEELSFSSESKIDVGDKSKYKISDKKRK